ncbi:uncharacterized protein LOC121382839 [Gigantopelta aegis]|uniref:uncharacterized protein LOC121382839 n=1 Tax=Gigantopelta aegis TaxID=1735272 RepID=UPI001B8880AE|nr:uncharacterized protein LOC121382839 [Gigantopelta aegis]
MVTSTGFSYANRFMGYVTEGLIVVAIAYGFYKLWNHFYLDDEYFESLAPPANNQQVYCRVLVIGLDDAGKTRFTRSFCKGKDRTEHPREKTTAVYVNSVRLGSTRLDMWDGT